MTKETQTTCDCQMGETCDVCCPPPIAECPRCGARSDKEAEKKCRPDVDDCPGMYVEFPDD